MIRSRCLLTSLGCLAAGLPAMAASVPLTELPEAVRRAAVRAVPGIELIEAEVESTRRGPLYELEGRRAGRRYEIDVTAGGEVVEIELETDEEVPPDDLPPAVRRAARGAVGGATLAEAERILRDGSIAYEIELVRDGQEFEVVVDEDGRVLDPPGEGHDHDDSDDDSSSSDDAATATRRP